jgi:hypothetical protein
VKISIAFERASHVNSGTSVDPEELPWPKTEGRVMRHPRLHLESDPRGEITQYEVWSWRSSLSGGLGWASGWTVH